MNTLFTIVSRCEDGVTYVDCEALNWSFGFDSHGAMVHGVELANRLNDDGYDLSVWAIAATVGDSKSFELV